MQLCRADDPVRQTLTSATYCRSTSPRKKPPRRILPEQVHRTQGGQKLALTNNRIENLRAATKVQNAQNSKVPVTNKSGVKGVCREKRYGGWRVTVRVDGKQKHIGIFRSLEEAEHAYDAFTKVVHGEFKPNRRAAATE